VNTVEQIEAEIDALSGAEQQRLIGNLLTRLKKVSLGSIAELEAMAKDPQVRRELASINREFTPVESDGLGLHS
jgi:hypothetical protein